VHLTVRPGESLGIVGESGSGKTTLGKCVVGLMPISAGQILFRGQVVGRPGRVADVPRVNGVQMVYQDPYSALNPKRTVGSTLREILTVHKLCARSQAQERSAELLESVGLSADILKRRPRSLSGGMCQRVAIARALAFGPTVLVADEVVSALDASVQALVLNLIADTRETTGLSVIFITHDLAVVNQVCDRVIVLNRGAVVESGNTADILNRPSDPYTRSLIDAVPELAGELWRR
jgi:ABC-type glutathione transport system ATPase component